MRPPPPVLPTGTECLAPFVDADVLDAAAVQVAATLSRSTGGLDDDVVVGAALAARAPMYGHVCIIPAEVAGTVVVDDSEAMALDPAAWPPLERWVRHLVTSPAVRGPDDPVGETLAPLVWDGTRLYLERYWRFEQQVADALLARARDSGGIVAASSSELADVLDRLFGPEDPGEPDRQRAATATALTRRLTVIAGGPGTGKTRTVARMLAGAHHLAAEHGRRLQVALAAPTGKAATRLTEAVREEARATALAEDITERVLSAEASTLHSLLGLRSRLEPRHDRSNPPPHDLVVVDETSMVSLPLMARLLDAIRPDATLVLAGDPLQLASVEAGAVLGDIVGPAAAAGGSRPEPPGPLADSVVMLERVHRFGSHSAIAALADAVRSDDPETVLELLGSAGHPDVCWVDGDDTEGIARLARDAGSAAVEVIRAARSGDVETALRLAAESKVLCATHRGPLGTEAWRAHIERIAGRLIPDADLARRWYAGRPVIVTRNDPVHHLVNGDAGVVVATPGGLRAAFASPDGPRLMAPSQLADVETLWAMTIHKSQGSEYARVLVSMPPPPSPILTRELLYTAVTRAKQQVTLVGTEESIRAAISRPVSRASGLAAKLWPGT